MRIKNNIYRLKYRRSHVIYEPHRHSCPLWEQSQASKPHRHSCRLWEQSQPGKPHRHSCPLWEQSQPGKPYRHSCRVWEQRQPGKPHTYSCRLWEQSQPGKPAKYINIILYILMLYFHHLVRAMVLLPHWLKWWWNTHTTHTVSPTHIESL